MGKTGEKMSEKTGAVTYVCPNCGKVNTIPYGDKLKCNDCVHGDKERMTFGWENPHKVNQSDNWILNKIGNLCGRIGHFISLPYYRWGTFWTFDELDLTEDIDREDEN